MWSSEGNFLKDFIEFYRNYNWVVYTNEILHCCRWVHMAVHEMWLLVLIITLLRWVGLFFGFYFVTESACPLFSNLHRFSQCSSQLEAVSTNRSVLLCLEWSNNRTENLRHRVADIEMTPRASWHVSYCGLFSSRLIYVYSYSLAAYRRHDEQWQEL